MKTAFNVYISLDDDHNKKHSSSSSNPIMIMIMRFHNILIYIIINLKSPRNGVNSSKIIVMHELISMINSVHSRIYFQFFFINLYIPYSIRPILKLNKS